MKTISPRSISFDELIAGKYETKAPALFEDFLWVDFLKPALKKRKTFTLRRMFGGLALYRKSALTLLLMEDVDRSRSYRGRTYSFPIWHGVLIPTERTYHPRLLKLYPHLVSHPVLGKWLFLKAGDKKFALTLKSLILQIIKKSPLIGVDSWKKVTDSTPIQNVPNLGKTSTEELRNMGVKTYGVLRKKGWRSIYQNLIARYPHRKNRNMARALLAACLKKDWRQLTAKDLALLN